MKRNVKENKGVQFSLFEDMREKTTEELVCELTNKNVVAEDCISEYYFEKLFNSLTPQRRRIAAAAVELYKRREVSRDKRKSIRSSVDACEEMKPLLCDLQSEEFWVICLNQAAKMINKVRISLGGIDQTIADVRLIMKELIKVNACAFIAVHNHPSGNPRPSTQDRGLTEMLKDAGKLMNIKLQDHIIIAHNNYYSFNDEGAL